MVKTRTRRSPLRKLVGITLFLVLLAVSGYGLAATGNFRNPFTVVTQMLGGGTGRAFNGEAPSGERGVRQAPSGVQGNGGGENQTSISWSEVGGLLFNLWFMAAISALVMLIHYPLEFVMRRLRKLRPQLRPPAPLSV